MQVNSALTIWVKGLWHQGLVASAVWASYGLQVIAICDSQTEKERLIKGMLPVFEPGLPELWLNGIESGCLKVNTINELGDSPKVLAIMHDTEVNELDEVNLESVITEIKNLSTHLSGDTILFITAQIPAGTCELIKLGIVKKRNINTSIYYMPENLRLGEAISRFQDPELPVIGSDHEIDLNVIEVLFPNTKDFHFCKLIEAEILKSALNTFLAISVVFGNEISEICDKFGVDGSRVMSLLKIENRIGKKLPLLPGLPFSGGTLGRDVQNLAKILPKGKNLLIKSIWESNEARFKYFIDVFLDIIYKNNFKSIGVLGLTYKPNTSTLRRSFSINLINSLPRNGIAIYGFDPLQDLFKEALPKHLQLTKNLDEVFQKTEILVIATPWEEFIDYLSNKDTASIFIVDPYGILAESNLGNPNYYQFGGERN